MLRGLQGTELSNSELPDSQYLSGFKNTVALSYWLSKKTCE